MKWTIALLSFYVFFTPSGIYQADTAPQTVLAASTKETPSGTEKTLPTASDQSENEADRKITQQVRQAVTKDDSLSTSAQNVTIVTQNGKVTLRGTVKSQGEKQKIADKAQQVSGVKNVDNQITIKQ
ncbi:MAG: BON domain-containing protein [Candidatus Binatia bacterium]